MSFVIKFVTFWRKISNIFYKTPENNFTPILIKSFRKISYFQKYAKASCLWPVKPNFWGLCFKKWGNPQSRWKYRWKHQKSAKNKILHLWFILLMINLHLSVPPCWTTTLLILDTWDTRSKKLFRIYFVVKCRFWWKTAN